MERQTPVSRARIRSRTLLRAALWCLLLAVITATSADPDLWGHVRFGLDIIREGTIPRVDPYSFTSDRQWINHEWGSEVVLGATYFVGGNAALILLKVVSFGVVLFLLGGVLRYEGVEHALVRDAMMLVAVLLAMQEIGSLRPQLFSVVGFAVLLYLLTRARTGAWRWLLGVPPLFVIWANVHGGWLVGGGTLLLWTAALALRGARTRALWCAGAGVVALVATLINPYGVEMWRFLYETVTTLRTDLVEWQPVPAAGWEAGALWALAMAMAAVGLLLEREQDRRLERIMVVAGIAVASFVVARLLAYFVLAILFLYGPTFGNLYRRWRDPMDAMRRRSRMFRRAAAVAAAAAAVVSIPVAAANLTGLELDPRWRPDPDAVVFLRQQPEGSRVLVSLTWGHYAIWHLSPGMRVSIDGRHETVYSSNVRERHQRFYDDAPGAASLPDEIAADYIWLLRTEPAVSRLMTDARWRRVYDGEQSVIFVRAGSAVVDVPAIAVDESAARVFPGP